ncbi:MAG: hypothetical protein J6A25_05845 [Lachnospiraceae bacterium]|nr:hypothetical protein [Lachnospiraceae bacterium]
MIEYIVVIDSNYSLITIILPYSRLLLPNIYYYSRVCVYNIITLTMDDIDFDNCNEEEITDPCDGEFNFS